MVPVTGEQSSPLPGGEALRGPSHTEEPSPRSSFLEVNSLQILKPTGKETSRFGCDVALDHPLLGRHPWCEDLEPAPGHSQPSGWERSSCLAGPVEGRCRAWMGFCSGLWAQPPSSSSKYRDKQRHLCWGAGGAGKSNSLTCLWHTGVSFLGELA